MGFIRHAIKTEKDDVEVMYSLPKLSMFTVVLVEKYGGAGHCIENAATNLQQSSYLCPRVQTIPAM